VLKEARRTSIEAHWLDERVKALTLEVAMRCGDQSTWLS